MAETIELSTLGAVIKTAYEGQTDTNAFTDAEKLKLSNISNSEFSGNYDDLTGKPPYVAAGASKQAVVSDLGVIPLSQKGQANGVAPLDSAGLVPLVHLNVGGLSFKGAWNPTTNTPSLVDGTGSVGDFYKASASGSFNFGNGEYTFLMGDWVIFAGGVWQRIGVSETVSMVNGKIGNIVLSASDVGALPDDYSPPISSVNGKTGIVVLSAADVGALPQDYVPPQVIPRLTYADRLSARAANTWYLNSFAHDRIINISTNYVAASASSAIEMRASGTTTPVFSARGQATGTGSTNQIMQAIVPSGWEYRFVPGTSRSAYTWFEGNYA